MRRLLGCLWYYFAWQRTMVWVTLIGALLMVAGYFAQPLPLGVLGMLLGAVFCLAFPVLLACVAYRRLISIRHFVLVPRMRVYASGALLALALIATAVAIPIYVSLFLGDTGAAMAGGTPPQALDPVVFALLVFSWISVYLLLSQWLVTYLFGLIGFGLVPFVLLRLGTGIDAGLAAALLDWRPWIAVALAGWIWLFVAARRGRLARGMATSLQASLASSWDSAGWSQAADPMQAYWLPRGGQVATPAGSLLRGTRDGWRNRLIMALQSVLLFPLSLIVLFFLMGMPLRGDEQQRMLTGMYLLLSFYGICMYSSMVFAEWPARARLLWLRVAGDRASLWQRLEKTLLGEIVLMTAVAALAGIASGLAFAIPPELVVLYVAGSALAGCFCGYLGFWIRSVGWSTFAQALVLIAIIVICFVALAWLRSNGRPIAIFWLLPAAAGFALVMREVARRRFLVMDWCKVRPARVRRPLLAGG